jgi:predicted RNase H-like HicB family nuclease
MSQYLYGIAHGRNGQWEAFSLDFDMAVQGRSFEEVSELLKEAIHAYVATAMEQPEPARSKLLRRTVPLRVRLLWGVKIALWTMFHKKRTEESTFGFPVSCPA